MSFHVIENIPIKPVEAVKQYGPHWIQPQIRRAAEIEELRGPTHEAVATLQLLAPHLLDPAPERNFRQQLEPDYQALSVRSKDGESLVLEDGFLAGSDDKTLSYGYFLPEDRSEEGKVFDLLFDDILQRKENCPITITVILLCL